MLRAVVIDDVDNIRQKNVEIIREYCPYVTVLAEANGVESGVAIIKQYAPDLVFLDIDMGDGTGFELLEKLNPFTFKVIFITGHESYATRAFRFSALDYLLKPLNPEDLIEAVNKAIASVDKEFQELKYKTLFSNIEQPAKKQKIILKTLDKVFSIHINDIIRCESEKNYTTFFLVNNEKLVMSTTLKEYETILLPMGFFRVHKSHLINLNYFDHFVKTDGGVVVLKDKTRIPISPRKKDAFLIKLEEL